MSTQTASPLPVSAQSLSGLIQHIVETHHAYLRNELPFLEERIAKMCANHGQERPEMYRIQQILQDLRDDLTGHLMKEEQVLFPYIRGLEESQQTGRPAPEVCFPSVRFPIRMMVMEHDGAVELVSELRSVSYNYTPPEFVCANGREFYTRLEGLEQDLHEHIRVENEELFPRAVKLEEAGQ
jgi:regulator of cell morphogenesis and NO signaling